MFCNKCGSALDAGSQNCPRCGAIAIGGAQPAVSHAPSTFPPDEEARLARRLQLLAGLWIVYGLFETARALAVHFFTRLAHFWVSGPDWSQWVGPWVLGWIVGWSLFNAALGFVAAWGLYERAPWGRPVAIFAAAVGLLYFWIR